MKNKQIRIYYIIADLIALKLGWICFGCIRFMKGAVVHYTSLADFFFNAKMVVNLFELLAFWMVIFVLSGYYNKVIGKSRLDEFFQTFFSLLLGTLVVFFFVILDDVPWTYRVYYNLTVYLFASMFVFVYGFRFIITQIVTNCIHKGSITRKSVIIGTGRRAVAAANEIAAINNALGYDMKGYVSLPQQEAAAVEPSAIAGNIDQLDEIVARLGIDEIIIAIDSDNDKEVIQVLYTLYKYNIPIKLYAGKSRILTGGVRVGALAGVPLISLTESNFSDSGNNIKFLLDRLGAFVGLLLLSPLFLFLMLRVRLDSKGSLFFTQWRIGYRGKPFKIWKFRTMYETDESSQPLLTTNADPRVTPYGRVMRKYRLDELPQLWNILKGEMSFVGPRPEQKYYIDQIIKEAPYYYLLHNVRPGLTSWGMVKYGYAATLEQMIERLQYDMLYYENMSLLIDLKIIIYTIRTVVTGKGV